MNILHIGGTGFLGTHIIKKLIKKNHGFTLLTRNPEKHFPFDNSSIKYLKGDITSQMAGEGMEGVLCKEILGDFEMGIMRVM